jgi:uncharacterized protein (DUF305 family)
VTAPGERWSRVGAPLLAGLSVVALLLGVLLGWLVFAPHHPGEDSAEAGFARDMYEHHTQAVEMSLEVLQSTEDDAVRGLAWDIATSQANQMGQMEAWIKAWGLSMARSGPRMEWMGHDGAHTPEGSVMPGMATPAEMSQLAEAEGEEADVLFLQLMITHHLAGVDMAEAGLELAEDPEVVRLAQAMANAQDSEIRLMATMLAERGAEPREDLSQLGTAGSSGDTDDATHGDGH